MADRSIPDPVAAALVALHRGEPRAAADHLATAPADPLARALAGSLARTLGSGLGPVGGEVYVNPEAFARFIDADPNLALYRHAVAALRRWLTGGPARTTADIGCGDGRISGPVAAGTSNLIHLIEPSEVMLAQALSHFDQGRAEGHPMSIEAWLTRSDLPAIDAAWATFALHNLEPDQRPEVLAGLARRVDRMAIVEFDIPAFAGIEDHALYCADRYRRGFQAHPDKLVRTGFLIPVLLGQFAPNAPRHTHEQPLAQWQSQLANAGFDQVEVTPLHHGFWWAPAGLVTGRGATTTSRSRR